MKPNSAPATQPEDQVGAILATAIKQFEEERSRSMKGEINGLKVSLASVTNYLAMLLYLVEQAPNYEFAAGAFVSWLQNRPPEHPASFVKLNTAGSVRKNVSELKGVLLNSPGYSIGDDCIDLVSNGEYAWKAIVQGSRDGSGTRPGRQTKGHEAHSPPSPDPQIVDVEQMIRPLGMESRQECYAAVIACLANIDGAVWPGYRGPIPPEYTASSWKMDQDPCSYRFIRKGTGRTAQVVGYTSIWRTDVGSGRELLDATAESGNVSVEWAHGYNPIAILDPKPGWYDGVISAIKLHPAWRVSEANDKQDRPPRREYLVRAVAQLLASDAGRQVYYRRLFIRFSHKHDVEFFTRPDICGLFADEIGDFPEDANDRHHDRAYEMEITEDVFNVPWFADLKDAYLRSLRSSQAIP